MIMTKIDEFFEIMMTTRMTKEFGISRHKVVDREKKPENMIFTIFDLDHPSAADEGRGWTSERLWICRL